METFSRLRRFVVTEHSKTSKDVIVLPRPRLSGFSARSNYLCTRVLIVTQ